MSSISKKDVINACNHLLNEKLNYLNAALLQINEASDDETKSTAGDKHETAKAMLQLEQEKLSAQINLVLHQQTELQKIDITKIHTIISNGSLIKTVSTDIFIGVSLGKLLVNGTEVIAISEQSPLAQKLLKQSVKYTLVFNNQSYVVNGIC